MAYTDKKLQIATQISFMYIDESNIKEYQNKYGINKFPTMHWLLTKSKKSKHIYGKYLKQFSTKAKGVGKIRRDSASKLIRKIKCGKSLCSNWRIVSVKDDNEKNGMYACLIETSEKEAIVSFRGSEIIGGIKQFLYDWLEADFGLLNSIEVYQQVAAREFIKKIADSTQVKQYDCYVLTGHSLGGNLAAHATITAPSSISDRIIKCYSFDGPGFSKRYIKKHKDNIIRNANKIIHYQWSFVGKILNQFESYGQENYSINISKINKNRMVYFFFRHDTCFIKFDKIGNITCAEMKKKFKKSNSLY